MRMLRDQTQSPEWFIGCQRRRRSCAWGGEGEWGQALGRDPHAASGAVLL